MASDKQRDITFRSKEIGHILAKIQSGDSVSVVGVGSVGKSNLLRHLLRRETQEYHLNNSARDLKMILIDPNNMLDSLPLLTGDQSSWAGYEIMVHRLYKAFYPFDGFSIRDQEEFTYIYDQLRAGANTLLPHIGLRYLEAALELLLSGHSNERPRWRIVFVFDEFEDMLANLPARFFQTLRGVRDDYKYKLTYITFTRRSLPQLVAENAYDQLALEPFIELFTDTTLYLGPYCREDAVAMLDRLSARKGVAHPPSFREYLLRVSGHHAGLLRASFELASRIAFGTQEGEATAFLRNSKPILTECHTIWESLTPPECKTLKQIDAEPAAVKLDDEVVMLLRQKYLVTDDAGELRIMPPLFREYVHYFAQA